MTTSVTIKDIPDELVEKLRSRAVANHHSLQDELIEIIRTATASDATDSPTRSKLTLAEAWEISRKSGASSPDESTQVIREMRDSRYRQDWSRPRGLARHSS